jgi:hypothetical protein
MSDDAASLILVLMDVANMRNNASADDDISIPPPSISSSNLITLNCTATIEFHMIDSQPYYMPDEVTIKYRRCTIPLDGCLSASTNVAISISI